MKALLLFLVFASFNAHGVAKTPAELFQLSCEGASLDIFKASDPDMSTRTAEFMAQRGCQIFARKADPSSFSSRKTAFVSGCEAAVRGRMENKRNEGEYQRQRTKYCKLESAFLKTLEN